MIRVLQIVGSMHRGGIETFLMNIYREIDKRKIQFDFLVHTQTEGDYDKEIRKLGGIIYNIPSRGRGIIQNKKSLDQFFNEHKEYKIVHQHVSSLTYIEPLLAAKKHGVKTRIIHSHNTNEPGGVIKKLTHYYNKLNIMSASTHRFACSHSAANWLYSKNVLKTKDYKVIKNAIKTDMFIYNEIARAQIRMELKIEGKTVIGHIGRFAHQKNHNLIIEIFNELYKKDQRYLLLLVGDGELRASIEDKVGLLGLTNNVIFTGVRKDISNLLQAMDIFIMPSYFEGLPVTLIEAQTADLPCIVSTQVSREAKLTDNVEWCDISDNVSVWVEKIKNCTNKKRENVKNKISELGYDIETSTNELQNFYEQSHFNV